MVADMKIVVFRLAKAFGLFALSRWLTRRGLRILCYHGIWLGEGHYGNFLFMSPEVFAGRMAFLSHAGHPVLSLEEAAARLNVALARLTEPLTRFRRKLAKRLDEEADDLDSDARRRIEATCRGIERRATVQLGGWRAML